jgi:hypothetical protein
MASTKNRAELALWPIRAALGVSADPIPHYETLGLLDKPIDRSAEIAYTMRLPSDEAAAVIRFETRSYTCDHTPPAPRMASPMTTTRLKKCVSHQSIPILFRSGLRRF